MKIRRATILDMEELWHLEQTQARCAHWGLEGWKQEIVQPFSQIWCAQYEEKIVGFASLRLVAGFGEILNVAVAPAYCRQGIGFKLLLWVVEQARLQGGKELTLEVNIYNRAAISLYQKVGFREIGRREKFYNGQEDALLMGLKL